MRYAHIVQAFAGQLWALQPDKLQAILSFLAFKADGGELTAAEIQARIAGGTASAVARREGAVALLPLRGLMSNRAPMVTDSSTGGGTSCEAFSAAFKAARDDADVKAIVIDTDSPGGATQGTDELAALIYGSRGSKPIVAQVNGNAASAAYWAISGADEIVLSPSALAGSIGVYGVHEDRSASLAADGIKPTIISAGRYKVEANPTEPLTDAAAAHIQSQVDAVYGDFVDRVAQGRNVAACAVRAGFGEGRMVLAKAAVAQGMADRIATLDETLARFGVRPAPAAAGKRAFAPARELRALALN